MAEIGLPFDQLGFLIFFCFSFPLKFGQTRNPFKGKIALNLFRGLWLFIKFKCVVCRNWRETHFFSDIANREELKRSPKTDCV